MTDNPDGGPDGAQIDSSILDWIYRFFVASGWTLTAPSEVTIEPFDPAPRVKQAELALAAFSISSEFLPDKRRAFATRKKGLSARIKTATDKNGFDDLDGDIALLAKEVAEQGAVVAARQATDEAIAKAKAKLDGLRPKLDRGGLICLEKSYAALVGDWSTAKGEAGFKAVKTQADDFIALAEKADTFATFYEGWFETSVTLIMTSVSETLRDDAKKLRRDALNEAILKSEAGQFDDAQAKLEAFVPIGVADAGDAADISAFLGKIAAFEAKYAKDIAVIKASWLRNTKDRVGAVKDIRKAGLNNRDYQGQIQALEEFQLWVEGNLPLAQEIVKHQQAMLGVVAFRDVITAMEALRGQGKWADALAEIKKLDKMDEVQKQSASLTYDKTMKAEYTALIGRLPKAQKAQMKAAWEAHKKAVDAKDFDAAETALAGLKELFVLKDLMDLREEQMDLFKGNDALAAYNYLESYKSLGKAGKYGEAKTEMLNVLKLLPALVDYIDLRKRGETVLAALPSDPVDLKKTLEDALEAADKTAKARKPEDASAALAAILSASDYEGLALEIADFDRRAAKVDKQQDKVLTFMELKPPQDTLVARLAAAKDLAQKDRKYDEAFAKLTEHSNLLVTAMDYATTRKQAKGIWGALERAITQSGETEDKLFSGGLKMKEIKTIFDKADGAAKLAKFDEARKAYAKLMNDCKIMTVQAVTFYETADASADCNAGHSIGRHGPKLTEEQLIERLKSGKAADWATNNKLSFTGASSKFKSMEDWLAGRELGASLALKENKIDVGKKTLDKDPKTGEFLAPVAQKFVIDHGKAIDEAFVGRKSNVSYQQATGEIKPEKTYETYEALTGITKARINFTWEFEKIGSDKPNSVDDYIAKYKAANSGNAPTDIKGRWVMMQQFPECNGWDQELQDYVLKDEEVT